MRTISKTFGSVETIVTAIVVEDAKPVVKQFTLKGRKNANSAAAILKKQLKTNNLMVKNVDVKDGGESVTYSIDAERFYYESSQCEEGETYGHDTVVVTFTLTFFDYVTMSDLENTRYGVFIGTTTENKLLRFAREFDGNDEDVLILKTSQGKAKRYMTREQFVENATRVK